MKVWNQAPLVRLLIPFLAGIITAVYFPFHFKLILPVISCLLIFPAAIVLVGKFGISYRRSYWFGFIINVLLFLFAYQLTLYKTEKFSSSHFSKISDPSHLYYARLSDPYVEKDRSLKAVLEITEVKKGDRWMRSCGKAMVYFKKDERSLKLKYGDELLLYADFKDVPEPQNPGEFNYRRFLAFHNIFEQAYVKDSWKSRGVNSGNAILSYSIGLRNNLLNVLTRNHLKGDEFSVGAALLLGYVDKLDANIIAAYSSTGALHVLSVSGLHVAIVYIVFSWCLFFLDKIKYGHVIKAALLILFLWFYAMLTGLSPSVLRAAAMFSFIIIAKAFKRHTNIYNTLAASALFLLLINPYLIMEVGFQLSYLAVIGIVYIQPRIYSWFEPKSWLLDQVWAITAVSIAAQIATFPLGLHYFHQFPNYFLLSNLIVIPISTVIIYAGIALFSFSKIPFLAKYLAIFFSWSVWLLNASVKWVEKLPHALIQGISISVVETWMFYGLIILFFYYFTKRKFIYLTYALALTVIVLCTQIYEQHKEFGQKKLIVYNVPKTSAIDFIDAKSNILLTDTSFAQNESSLLFHVKHNWWEMGVSNNRIVSGNIETTDLYIKNNFLQFFDKRIVLINQAEKENRVESVKPLNLDYLIISNNSKVKICELKKMYAAKMIVFDSSNSNYVVDKWKKECLKLEQPFYSVSDSGALIITL